MICPIESVRTAALCRSDLGKRAELVSSLSYPSSVGVAPARGSTSRLTKALHIVAAAITITTSGIGSAEAQATSWEGTTSSSWFDGSNWDAGTVPAAAANVAIDTYSSSTNQTPFTPEISAATNAINSLMVGGYSLGTRGVLTISEGGHLTSYLGILGNSSASEGRVTVTGVDSEWDIGDGSGNYNKLYVGQNGTGRLYISDGGVVRASHGYLGNNIGASGEVTVSGNGSVLSLDAYGYVGKYGIGILTIENGGKVESVDTYIGFNAGSNGTVTVTGSDLSNPTEVSTWTIDGVFDVGSSGYGKLIIENGGYVSAKSVYISYGTQATGSVTVTGNGSKLVVVGNLYVAGVGTGSLLIESGGYVHTSDKGYVAKDQSSGSFSNGHVSITGSGSEWKIDENLYVGRNGNGDVTISDEGKLTVSGDSGIFLSGHLSNYDAGSAILNIGAAEDSDAPLAPGIVEASMITFGYGSTKYSSYGSGTIINEGFAKLVFNHTDETGTFDFAPDLTSLADGTRHTITHVGGWTNLTGDGSGFKGSVEITGGTLAIADNSELSGTVSVGGTGTLAGTGTLSGAVNINSGGTIAPGGQDSIGTLAVNGITLSAGSFFEVDLEAGDTNDLILVDNIATLNGGTVSVGGTFLIGEYTILTSAEILGSSANLGLEFDSLFYEADLIDDGADITLRITELSDFGAACDSIGTSNQSAVCRGITSLPVTEELRVEILNMEPDAIPVALDALTGTIGPSVKNVVFDFAQLQTNALKNHFNEFLYNDSTLNDEGLTSLAESRSDYWVASYGSQSTKKETNRSDTTKADLSGLMVGYDHPINAAQNLGFFFGYGHADVTQDEVNSTASFESWSAGFYSNITYENIMLDIGAIYASHGITSNRYVAVAGLDQTLNANYDAHSLQLFAELSQEFESMPRFFVEPFLGLSHVTVRTDAYSETGGSAALSARADTQSAMFTKLGFRSDYLLPNAVLLNGSLAWAHAMGGANSTSTMNFLGGDSFEIGGQSTPENLFEIGIGIELPLSAFAEIKATYSKTFGDGYDAQGGYLTLSASF